MGLAPIMRPMRVVVPLVALLLLIVVEKISMPGQDPDKRHLHLPISITLQDIVIRMVEANPMVNLVPWTASIMATIGWTVVEATITVRAISIARTHGQCYTVIPGTMVILVVT